jgi:hypothetical protein
VIRFLSSTSSKKKFHFNFTRAAVDKTFRTYRASRKENRLRKNRRTEASTRFVFNDALVDLVINLSDSPPSRRFHSENWRFHVRCNFVPLKMWTFVWVVKNVIAHRRHFFSINEVYLYFIYFQNVSVIRKRRFEIRKNGYQRSTLASSLTRYFNREAKRIEHFKRFCKNTCHWWRSSREHFDHSRNVFRVSDT